MPMPIPWVRKRRYHLPSEPI